MDTPEDCGRVRVFVPGVRAERTSIFSGFARSFSDTRAFAGRGLSQRVGNFFAPVTASSGCKTGIKVRHQGIRGTAQYWPGVAGKVPLNKRDTVTPLLPLERGSKRGFGQPPSDAVNPIPNLMSESFKVYEDLFLEPEMAYLTMRAGPIGLLVYFYLLTRSCGGRFKLKYSPQFAFDGGVAIALHTSTESVTAAIEILKEMELVKCGDEIEVFYRSKPKYRYIPDWIKEEVFDKAGGKCQWCGSDSRLEYDHVFPVALGGANERSNIQLLCLPCNRRKGKRLIKELGVTI